METEFEAKFYPVDKDKYRAKLLSAGAKLLIPERRMLRTVIDRNLHPQLKSSYIRVRDEGNLVRLSAKSMTTQSGQMSDQKETDVIVSDYQKCIEIIEMMGLTFDRTQETLRETWELENAEITIDTWPGLDPYSEIETSSEAEVQRLAIKLGFDWSKKIITPAAELFVEKYHLPMEKVLEMITFITFDHNPFAGLPTYPIANSQTVVK
jgi:adenylate cyclase, class 2